MVALVEHDRPLPEVVEQLHDVDKSSLGHDRLQHVKQQNIRSVSDEIRRPFAAMLSAPTPNYQLVLKQIDLIGRLSSPTKTSLNARAHVRVCLSARVHVCVCTCVFVYRCIMAGSDIDKDPASMPNSDVPV